MAAIVENSTAVRIERMMAAIFTNEQSVKDAESEGGDVLTAARAARDKHIETLNEAINYGLDRLYMDTPCECSQTLPKDVVGFVEAVGSDRTVDPSCSMCLGRGHIRVKSADSGVIADHKRITYFKSVVRTTMLCAKVRSKTADSSDAYLALEKEHERLISMFSNENQTSMECDDAEQGARMGIVDAAMRFDPTRKECANFGTVAYNWAYRNSRARKDTDKRAGVYAPSVDSFVSTDDGQTSVTVVDGDGPVGSLDSTGKTDSTLVMDMRSKLAELPELQRTLMMLIMSGHSISSAADEMGIARSKAVQIRDQAYSGLRSALSSYVEAVRD